MKLETENKEYKKMMGYDYDEVETINNKDGTTKIITTKKHVPADTKAIIKYLKENNPNEWQ